MTTEEQYPENLSLKELSFEATTFQQDRRDIANAEITRRVAQAQIDAARYMKWSVVAIAVTSGLTVLATLFAWLWPNPLHH